MALHVGLTHKTEYHYDRLVSLAPHTIRLRPAPHCRTPILAYRPAPVQVSYLGYPGTLGAAYVDYLMADETVIPEEAKRHYAEQVVWLPDSYQVNDRKRAIGATPRRAAVAESTASEPSIAPKNSTEAPSTAAPRRDSASRMARASAGDLPGMPSSPPVRLRITTRSPAAVLLAISPPQEASASSG